VQYLSDEWIEAANAAVAGLEPMADPFAVSYVITGGPGGDRSYTLTLGPPAVGIQSGSDANVGLRMSWDVARGIATAELSSQRAFLDGDIRIDGDPQVLLGHGGGLAAVEERLADLRSRTQF
jgi:hypothetical protein